MVSLQMLAFSFFNKEENMIWWEKTVEYLFAKLCLGESSVMPLDGKQEQIGDLLVFNDSKMLIIEFKRDEKSLSSEKAKFGSEQEWIGIRDKAVNEYPIHNFHILMFAELQNESSLKLKSKTYWDNTDIGIYDYNEHSFKEYINNYGKPIEILKKYLNFLFSEKKSKGASDGITANSLHNCSIVSIADGKIKTLSLEEFIKGYNLELNKKLEKNLKNSQRRSFGMRR